mmetsp:Transcript_13916/g.24387  ORF Transcript_13916/g.24387 Transcript_13916/m.24387 type:complete len:358 (+) Transcript_13916:97-1170(+)|eukprot:CAMPEP_0119103694 /NCGR_PEP_ID=MMETSP1180-20130426/2079_1 /TAXON_ID=3052 ORGANISM="Chlamydomonas cf sp, Strain CCMP681" /NCGR_SAMPLE_ID=MMETSP1180 /ASSEMBLY_ACC=CAM_ASM_000741 /LENGTH=357 /DNA_ID=CAMNT_0007088263 /DNA_START=82 /DNA_END=1155 /DNA_ORIENTATION=-
MAAQQEKRQKLAQGYEHTRESFMEVYAVLRDEMLVDPVLGKQPTHAQEWFTEVMDYNVPGGKLNRGMAVYDVLSAIKDSQALSDHDIFLANSLGWCIEWLQAFFLVADDIMDGSITRRNQPCWYKQGKVGLVACNDYILLECCIYQIINKHFDGHANHLRVLKLFHEVTFQTASGQLLDLITAPQGTVDLTKYTMDNYMRIVTYKTAFYSFYLPVACGMLLAGISDSAHYKVAEMILVEMGQYFQIQDDYLDCYGDSEVIGKIGTDIEDNKCSWLICTALQQATEAQKELIKENYGHKDAANVSAIKTLYKEMGLEEKYKSYEADSYETLTAQIAAQTALPQAVFTSLLKKIYKRSK